LGAAFFQFQTAHFKGGSETNFGLFRLGSEKFGDIHPPCDEIPSKCPTWPVYCLSKDLNWLPGSMADRAEAVAAAWGGSVPSGRGFCHEGGRRLSLGPFSDEVATRIACQIRIVPDSELDVQKRLQEESFSMSLARSTKAVLGDDSDAILGELLLQNPPVNLTQEESVEGTVASQSANTWLLPAMSVALLAVACGLAIWIVLSKKKARKLEASSVQGSEV